MIRQDLADLAFYWSKGIAMEEDEKGNEVIFYYFDLPGLTALTHAVINQIDEDLHDD
jgi:hypothetical protein